jgi:hypothetical protein
MSVSVDVVFCFCRFVGCVSSAIVYFECKILTFGKFLSLLVCEKGIHVAGGAPKRKCQLTVILHYSWWLNPSHAITKEALLR